MEPFEAILKVLAEVSDNRRGQGKRYTLHHLLLFTILAVLTGANSYRSICTFIEMRFQDLTDISGLRWRRAPAHTSIRSILPGIGRDMVEQAFRVHAAAPDAKSRGEGVRVVAMDGKTLRGSLDNFNDRKAVHILSAFATDTAIILGHPEIDDRSNGIPAAQRLLADLGLAGEFATADAMNCQKKRSRPPVTQSAP